MVKNVPLLSVTVTLDTLRKELKYQQSHTPLNHTYLSEITSCAARGIAIRQTIITPYIAQSSQNTKHEWKNTDITYLTSISFDS